MFKNAFELTEISGFKIRLDPSWILIAALIVWSLADNYFPETLPGYTRYDYLALSVVSMLGFFASLVLHELSHSIVARRYGLKIEGITLFIFGGVAQLDEEPRTPVSEFWIAIAGPIASFVLAGGFYALAGALTEFGSSLPLVAALNYLALINFVLACFNLVPAFPLDGGRILRAMLWYFKKDLLWATSIASMFGTGFGWFLIILGVLSLFSQNTMGGFWQILIGFFVINASRGSYQQLVISNTLKGQNVNSIMSRKVYSAQIDQSVQSVIDNIIIAKNVTFVPVLEGNHLMGFVSLDMLQSIDEENRQITKIMDVFEKTSLENTITPLVSMEQLFKKMVEGGRRKMLVEEDGKLLGVVSLADMMTFLAIRNDLHAGVLTSKS
ncbi:site-2 protease family protein [Lentilitoribacter sp. Alg239-R112]|uniref:site-2 protease family protein n=1 Tax=Lentilitoribacter sp. Alg239-R112 TaxID=2305987 RepID=UPI0013A68CE9|nr:site-2 protease family protein [Lentilitoribacter sp. Alg239-R112]